MVFLWFRDSIAISVTVCMSLVFQEVTADYTSLLLKSTEV